MLELRPTCEHCNRALPPQSTEARICSYECNVLRVLRRYRVGQRLPQLRGRVCSAADPAGDELEG